MKDFKSKSNLMIILFSFLGIIMISTIMVTNYTKRGTFSIEGGFWCYIVDDDDNRLNDDEQWFAVDKTGDMNDFGYLWKCRPNDTPTPTPAQNCEGNEVVAVDGNKKGECVSPKTLCTKDELEGMYTTAGECATCGENAKIENEQCKCKDGYEGNAYAGCTAISVTPTPAGNTPTPAGNTPTPAGNTPTPAGNTPTPAGNNGGTNQTGLYCTGYCGEELTCNYDTSGYMCNQNNTDYYYECTLVNGLYKCPATVNQGWPSGMYCTGYCGEELTCNYDTSGYECKRYGNAYKYTCTNNNGIYTCTPTNAANQNNNNNNNNNANNNNNVTANPTTGGTAIIVAWILGILTIGYSVWYFKKSSSINNQ